MEGTISLGDIIVVLWGPRSQQFYLSSYLRWFHSGLPKDLVFCGLATNQKDAVQISHATAAQMGLVWNSEHEMWLSLDPEGEDTCEDDLETLAKWMIKQFKATPSDAYLDRNDMGPKYREGYNDAVLDLTNKMTDIAGRCLIDTGDVSEELELMAIPPSD